MAFKIPKGAVLLKEYVRDLANRENVQPSAVYMRIYRKKLNLKLLRKNVRTIYVLP